MKGVEGDTKQIKVNKQPCVFGFALNALAQSEGNNQGDVMVARGWQVQ